MTAYERLFFTMTAFGAIGVASCSAGDVVVERDVEQEETELWRPPPVDVEELRRRDEAAFAELKRADDLIKAQYTEQEQLEILARAGIAPDQIDVVYDPRFDSPLSIEERAAVQALVEPQGISPDRLRFAGRTMVLDGDMYFDANDLLAAGASPAAEEKGRVLAAQLAYEEGALPRPLRRAGSFEDGPIFTPIIFAQNNNGLSFLRPFTNEPDGTPRRVYYLVYQENYRVALGAPAQPLPPEIPGLLRDAAHGMLAAVPDDCLYTNAPHAPSLFNVISQSHWNSLSAITRAYNIRIRVVYGPSWDGGVPNPTCPETQAAATCDAVYSCDRDPQDAVQLCAVFPRYLTKSTQNGSGQVTGSVTRLHFGTHIGINTSEATVFGVGPNGLANPRVSREERVRLLMHEIGHLMGLAHPDGENLSIAVPGTSGAPEKSIMYSAVHPETPGPSNTPSSDDYMTIKTLYSSKNTCLYQDAFRAVQPLVCPAGSIQSGDLCCSAACGSCGGAGCSGRPGGSANCCTGTIRSSGVYCGNAPCILR